MTDQERIKEIRERCENPEWEPWAVKAHSRSDVPWLLDKCEAKDKKIVELETLVESYELELSDLGLDLEGVKGE